MAEVRRRPDTDYYKVLQVDPSAEPEVIEAAYRALSKKYHPDVNRTPQAETRMAQINSAYDVLSDPLKRRDYNQLRQGLPFTRPADRPENNPSTSRPANTTPPTSRPPSATKSEPASDGGTRPPQTPRPRQETPANHAAKKRPAYTYIPNNEKSFSIWPWVFGVVLFVAIAVGVVLLMEAAFGNPLKTTFVTSSRPQPTESTVVQPTAPVATLQPTPTITPLATSSLSRESALTFLQNADFFDRRVIDLALQDKNTLKLTIKLSDKGGATNVDNPNPPDKATPLDTLRQAEQTSYALIYSLFRQYPDLNRLILNLTDAKSEQKIVYRADLTRAAAFSFYQWRGYMNPTTKTLQDLTRAATEDRLALHYGGTTDPQQNEHQNKPDQSDIEAEINTWVPEGVKVNIEGSGAVSVSYLLNKNDLQMKSDWARIFYALYTRFPNLDRISITKGVAGTTGELRIADRTLFNRITASEWARLTFSNTGDARPLIDSLPNIPNGLIRDNSTLQNINAGGIGRTSGWEITVSKPLLSQANIAGFASTRQQFLLVAPRLTNIGKNREWPNPSQLFTLVDSQGTIYRPNQSAANAYYLTQLNQPPFAPIEPGASADILLVFDVPANISGLKLQLSEGGTIAVLALN